ncbi:MAG: hypothetical protein WA190_11175 [Usitatibacter sp.]
MATALMVLGLYTWYSCSESAKSTSTTIETPSATPDDLEAEDAAKAIRRFHPIACRSGKADWRYSGCHDDTKGYDNLRMCVSLALTEAKDALSDLPPSKVASRACGIQFENAARGVIEGTATYLTALDGWLAANEKKLRPLMTSKSLWDACNANRCDGLPESTDAAYERMSFAHINQIECMPRLFRCGPADNVCWIGKVAARLGASCTASENHTTDPYQDKLSVRSTGRVIAAP